MIFRLFFFLFALLLPLASHAADINVRAGVHEGSNRLVFDWSEQVQYKLDVQGGQASLSFDKPNGANLAAANKANLNLIRNLSQEKTSGGLRVSFAIPQGAKVQAFRSGTKVGVDVLLSKNIKPDFATTSQKKPETPVVAAKESEKPKPAETVPAKPPEPVTPPVAIETTPAVKTEAGVSMPQTLADLLDGKTKPASISAPSSDVLDQPAVSAPVKEPPDGTVIRLSPSQLSRLAAFVRAGKLWLVTDQNERSLRPYVEGILAASLQNVTRIDVKTGTAFMFDLPDDGNGLTFAIKRVDREWQLFINPQRNTYLPAPLSLTLQDDPQRLGLYAGESPAIVSLKDPALGDRLWIIPARAPEGRIITLRNMAGFSMLPTLMGAAITPQDDKLRITTEQDLVMIASLDKAQSILSNDQDRKKAGQRADAGDIFRYKIGTKGVKGDDFDTPRQSLEKILTETEDDTAKATILVDLARLHINFGFGTEALGLLDMASKADAKLAMTPPFIALRGVAAALGYQGQMMQESLSDPAVQSYPQAKLWMGYGLAKNQQWTQARASFLEAGNAVPNAPQKLQGRLLLAQGETSLQAKDLVGLDRVIKLMEKMQNDLQVSEKAGLNYLRAGYEAAKGKDERAIMAYEDLASGTDSYYRARSQLALIDQQLKDKTIDQKQAIDALERERFSWRGDRLEIQILRRLGQAYVDNKQYAEGLDIWRQSASLSQDSTDTDAITQDMQQTFKNLYVKGDADKLSPLQAVALFQQFRELTPTGEDGNTALLRLVDRLVTVDLLDQADDLLTNQVLKQTQGEESLKLATKLARIRIQNDKPEAALQVLTDSDPIPTQDEKLLHQRKLLRVRALADLNKSDEALAELGDDKSEAALSLRVDLYWRQNRWSDATVALQDLLLFQRDAGKNAVDGPMPALILKMAIAMALDENTKGLALLSTQYGDFMAKTKQTNAFTIITQPQGSGALADLETLKNQVQGVELFEKFLKDF